MKFDINLSPKQSEIFAHPARHKVVVCGRRFGKSYLAIVWIIYQALKAGNGTVHYYIARDWGQVRRVAWILLKQLTQPIQARRPSESEFKIVLKNGAVIQLMSGHRDNMDSIRGVTLHSAVLDECAFCVSDLWDEIVSPCFLTTSGPVLFITTPKGHNWVKELYDNAITDKPGWDDWYGWRLSSLDGGLFPASEYEKKRLTTNPVKFAQEYEASFDAVQNRVYSLFDYVDHVRSNLASVSDTNTLHIGLDFNRTPMTAVVGIKAGQQFHVVDEISLENSSTREMADEIRLKYPNHVIYIYPDSSGKAESAVAGDTTNFTILKEAKYNYHLVVDDSNPKVIDRINEVQNMLSDSEGNARLFVHPRCTNLIKTLDNLQFKQSKHSNVKRVDKQNDLDHMHDCLGYVIHQLYPMREQMTNWRVKGVAA